MHIGPIMSGERITTAGRQTEILNHNRKILAVEMESYGVLSAIRGAKMDTLVVRGIADFADDSKNDDWRRTAAINASAFAFEVVARLKIETTLSPEPAAEHREDLAIQYISRFSIANLRSITEVNWQVAKGPGWHVVIGHNGAGKTTVLRARAVLV